MDVTNLSARVDQAAENSYAKIIARYIFPPVMGAIVGLGAWAVNNALNNLTTAISETKATIASNKSEDQQGHVALWNAQGKTADAISTVTKTVDSMATTVGVLSVTVANDRQRSDEGIARASQQIDTISHSLFAAPPAAKPPP